VVLEKGDMGYADEMKLDVETNCVVVAHMHRALVRGLKLERNGSS
jgi:hypothetical protein